MPTLNKMLATLANAGPSPDCSRPAHGPHAGYIPNVVVRTHMNQRAWFYDDLILGRIVLIHCMAIGDAESCRNVETMARVQAHIGKELGQSIFIYSITTNPEHDTPDVLRRFAEKNGARDGWLFLTGDVAALSLVRQRLFIHSGGQDCSMSLLRYGNEAVGLWGGTPLTDDPGLIMQRLSWIKPRERPAGPPQRGGPPLLIG